VSQSTGPILAAGAITLLTDVIVTGRTWQDDTKVVVATGIAAAGLALVEKASPEIAVGIAYLALFTVLFVRVDPANPSPVEAFFAWYNKK
jgi:hypothetical protein